MERQSESRPDRRARTPLGLILFLSGLAVLVVAAGILATVSLARLFGLPLSTMPISTRPLQGTFSPAWSGDEQTLLLSDQGAINYLWSLPKNTLVRRDGPTCNLKNLSMSAFTGRYEICTSFKTGAIRAFDEMTGTQTIDYNDHRDHWTNLMVSQDGMKVAFMSNRMLFQVWDLSTGKVQLTVQLPVYYPGDLPTAAWSPNERLLALHYQDQTVQVWNLTTKQAAYYVSGPGIAYQGGYLVWAADSVHLGMADTFITGEHTVVDIWDLSRMQPYPEYRFPYDPSFTYDFGYSSLMPTTLRLLAEGQSFLLSGYNRLSLFSTTSHRVLLSEMQKVAQGTLNFQISPDTDLLEVSSSQTIEIYNVVTGQKLAGYGGLGAIFSGGIPPLRLPAMLGAWSPDSHSIASAGRDDRLHVWDARTGQDRASYHFQVGYPSALVWSPNGRMIALVTSSSSINTPVSITTTPQEIATVVATSGL